MNYELTWMERHTVKVEAKNLDEAWVLSEGFEPETTKKEVYDSSARCPNHRVEVNDDYPCEQCLQEAAEEGEADYAREA